MLFFRKDITLFLLDTNLFLLKNKGNKKNKWYKLIGRKNSIYYYSKFTKPQFSIKNIDNYKNTYNKLLNYSYKKEIILDNPKKVLQKEKIRKNKINYDKVDLLKNRDIEKNVDAIIYSNVKNKIDKKF